jgi:hypothetical protein
MKTHNAKRKGSSFPKQRDAKYRKWVRTENDCMLRGDGLFPRVTLASLSLADSVISRDRDTRVWWVHNCWGPIDPAHVGDSQARGAPDFGVIVPLCRAAHDYYDHHRSKWRKTTGYSEKQMASAASGYALAYVERGGVPVLSGKETALDS